jgi:hypothetical protein
MLEPTLANSEPPSQIKTTEFVSQQRRMQAFLVTDRDDNQNQYHNGNKDDQQVVIGDVTCGKIRLSVIRAHGPGLPILHRSEMK